MAFVSFLSSVSDVLHSKEEKDPLLFFAPRVDPMENGIALSGDAEASEI